MHPLGPHAHDLEVIASVSIVQFAQSWNGTPLVLWAQLVGPNLHGVQGITIIEILLGLRRANLVLIGIDEVGSQSIAWGSHGVEVHFHDNLLVFQPFTFK